MNLKRVIGAAAIAAGVAISPLMFGVGLVSAAPMPNPSPNPPQPDMSQTQAPAPATGVLPQTGGGGPKGGHGATQQPGIPPG